MARGLLWLVLAPALVSQTHSSPVNSTLDPPLPIKSERSWLWGWVWGAESTVSVVDRSPVLSFPSRPAAFGVEINEPILGYVIPLSSFTVPCEKHNISSVSLPHNSGCPPLCLSGPNSPTETWIALVQRGQCEFVKKVREAQRLGAKAVVVGGEDPERSGYPDMLVNMYSPEDASDVRIAATYIRYSDYSQLFSLIEASNTTHSGLRTLSLLITAEYSAWEWYSPIITFVVILLLPSILTFVTLLFHRIRASRAAQRERAPEEVVRSLPWRIWTGNGWEKHDGTDDPDQYPPPAEEAASEAAESGDLQGVSENEEGHGSEQSSAAGASTSSKSPSDQPWFEQQQECAICLSDFAKGDKVRVLPCHHIFHLAEVDEWLIQRKKLCPVCKADVTQHPESTESSFPPPSMSPPPSEPRLQPTASDNATERTPLLTSTVASSV